MSRSRHYTRGIEKAIGLYFGRTTSRKALGPAKPTIQWVPGALSLGVKRPGREAEHSSPSSADFEQCVELHLHSPIRLHGEVLN